jgi:Carboxypeptidase regulatory-like domain
LNPEPLAPQAFKGLSAYGIDCQTEAVSRFVFISLVGALLWGQSSTTGNLQGIVVDTTGSPLPGASLTLRSLSSGAARTLESQEDGRFSIASLPIGNYSLRIEHESFNPVTVEPLNISVGQTVTQRIVMNLATLTQKLDVQEQADALQTTAITENVTFGGDRIEEAPAQNRNYLNFVLVAPGVAASQGANTSRSAAGIRNSANDSGLVFNGMRGRNNSISIDGVDNRDETTGGNRVAVGLEMVQEFRVAGTSVDAEFGGAAGGLVNMVTHTGQNEWHGDFTLFHQNQYLNARSPEAEVTGRPHLRHWQPGTSTGGPIRRDKTFFFTAIAVRSGSLQPAEPYQPIARQSLLYGDLRRTRRGPEPAPGAVDGAVGILGPRSSLGDQCCERPPGR